MAEMSKGKKKKSYNGNQVISHDKGKVTFLPYVAPPFLYQLASQSIDGFPG